MSEAVYMAKSLVKKGEADRAAKVLRAAAESGNTEASFQLGLLYYDGVGVLRDFVEAGRWFKLADDSEHTKAPYYLGRLEEYGGRYENAVEWYKAGAEVGFHSAIARLGICYLLGRGVEKSKDKAFRCFQESKEAGNFRAHVLVGKMLASGHLGAVGRIQSLIELLYACLRVIRFPFTTEFRSDQDLKDRFLV